MYNYLNGSTRPEINSNKLDTPRGRNEAYVNRVGRALNDQASPNEFILKRGALAPDIDTFVANLNALKFNLSEFNQLKDKLLAYINVATGVDTSGVTPTSVVFIKTSYNMFTSGIEEIVLHNYSYGGSIINLILKNTGGVIEVSADKYVYLGGGYTENVDNALANLRTKVDDNEGNINELTTQLGAIKDAIGSSGGTDGSITSTIIRLSNDLATHKTEANEKHTVLDAEVSDLSNRVYSLEQLIGTGGGSGNVGLATLAGTTLKFNSDLAFIDGITELNMLFSCGDVSYSKLTISHESSSSVYVIQYDNTEVYYEDVNSGTATWIKEDYRTIKIFSGEDVTNQDKIAWALGNSNIITSGGGNGTGGIDTSVFVTVESLNTKLADYATTSSLNGLQSQITENKNQITGIKSLYVKSISYDSTTGVFTIIDQSNGETKYDLAIEKVVANFTYDANTEELVLTLADGTAQRVPMSALVVDGYTKLEMDNKLAELRELINNSGGAVDAYTKGESDDKFATLIFQEEATLRMNNIETTIGEQDKALANLRINVTNAQTAIETNTDDIAETKSRVTVNEEDIVVLENKVTSLESNVGVVEEATLPSGGWSPVSNVSPYTYSSTITLSSLSATSSSIELINDQPVLFSAHGFAIASVSGSNVVVYSIGQPTADVTLTFEVVN